MTSPTIDALLRTAYDAFNRRHVDGALTTMDPEVQWANGWEGGHVVGHDAVRAYWTRQWRELDPTVTPLDVTISGDGRAVVTVDQVVRTPDGNVVRAGTVRHLYTLRNGLVTRMDIEAGE